MKALPRTVSILIATSLLASCAREGSIVPPPASQLAVGTWGGDKAGVLVDAATAHVHIGCTNGNFPRPASLDAEGRFNVAGEYVVRAFPVQTGPPLPAQFAGVVAGNQLTLSVAVDDTVEKKLVVLGPVTVTLGRQPQMENCPICTK